MRPPRQPRPTVVENPCEDPCRLRDLVAEDNIYCRFQLERTPLSPELAQKAYSRLKTTFRKVWSRIPVVDRVQILQSASQGQRYPLLTQIVDSSHGLKREDLADFFRLKLSLPLILIMAEEHELETRLIEIFVLFYWTASKMRFRLEERVVEKPMKALAVKRGRPAEEGLDYDPPRKLMREYKQLAKKQHLQIKKRWGFLRAEKAQKITLDFCI